MPTRREEERRFAPLCPPARTAGRYGAARVQRSPRKPIPHPRSLPPVPNGGIAARVSFIALPYGAARPAAAFLGRCPRPLSGRDSRMARRSNPSVCVIRDRSQWAIAGLLESGGRRLLARSPVHDEAGDGVRSPVFDRQEDLGAHRCRQSCRAAGASSRCSCNEVTSLSSAAGGEQPWRTTWSCQYGAQAHEGPRLKRTPYAPISQVCRTAWLDTARSARTAAATGCSMTGSLLRESLDVPPI